MQRALICVRYLIKIIRNTNACFAVIGASYHDASQNENAHYQFLHKSLLLQHQPIKKCNSHSGMYNMPASMYSCTRSCAFVAIIDIQTFVLPSI